MNQKVIRRFTVSDIRRIATEVAHRESPAFRVVGVTAGEGGSDYVEVLVTVADCEVDPCRIVIGLDRHKSVDSLRSQIKDALRDHARKHPTPAPEPVHT